VNCFSLSSYDFADLSSPGSVVRGSSAGKSDLLLRSLAQRCGAVRVCTNPALCRSASLVVPPQAHEGVTLRFIGLLGLSWGLLSFQWTRGISVPHTRQQSQQVQSTPPQASISVGLVAPNASTNGSCFKCGQVGHYTNYCPNKAPYTTPASMKQGQVSGGKS
jgi:hypothetical protein